jgi:hypothetical protein
MSVVASFSTELNVRFKSPLIVTVERTSRFGSFVPCVDGSGLARPLAIMPSADQVSEDEVVAMCKGRAEDELGLAFCARARGPRIATGAKRSRP